LIEGGDVGFNRGKTYDGTDPWAKTKRGIRKRPSNRLGSGKIWIRKGKLETRTGFAKGTIAFNGITATRELKNNPECRLRH
jgi:hypothetical protein